MYKAGEQNQEKLRCPSFRNNAGTPLWPAIDTSEFTIEVDSMNDLHKQKTNDLMSDLDSWDWDSLLENGIHSTENADRILRFPRRKISGDW